MASTLQILLGALSLSSPSLAVPTRPLMLEARQSNAFTLTAYAPDNATLNGAKAQNGGSLFQEKVGQYCPTVATTSCPNGTETVWYPGLYPSSMVPGGQDMYVAADGGIYITVQHSHSIPLDAYPNYQGWSYVALPPNDGASMLNCPADDPRYNCGTPTGYYTFHAPDAPEDVGGIVACPSPYYAGKAVAYAVTPKFNLTGCTPMLGLGSHAYTGIIPPVWSY